MKTAKKVLVVLLMSLMMASLFAGGATETSAKSTAGGTTADGTVILKIGTTAPPVVQVTQSAIQFGEKLKEVSGGKMDVQMNTSGSLGNTAQHYAQLGEGVLDMFVTAFDTETVMKDSQDFSIFVVPFAFDDNAHLRRFLETDTFKSILAKTESANGVKYLGLLGDLLPRALSTTNTPVYTTADVKNLKIRTPESVPVVSVWKAWGASPIQTPGNQIYSSLESGLCDGQDNDVIGSTSTPLYEVQKYYMEINYIMQSNVMWMSQNCWDALNEEQRGWVMEAMRLVDESFSKNNQALYGQSKQLMLDHGVQFVDVDTQSFKDSAAQIVAEQFDGKLFSKGLFDAVRAVANK